MLACQLARHFAEHKHIPGGFGLPHFRHLGGM
jgi:hypothetical protein